MCGQWLNVEVGSCGSWTRHSGTGTESEKVSIPQARRVLSTLPPIRVKATGWCWFAVGMDGVRLGGCGESLAKQYVARARLA
jgi:hypothetical protein